MKLQQEVGAKANRSLDRVRVHAGPGGIMYEFVVNRDEGQVMVAIYDDRRCNVYEGLLAKRNEIDTAFGPGLEWDAKDDPKACRLIIARVARGLDQRDRWNEIQQEMIKVFVELRNAFSKHLPQD